ncbi:ImuA family protein [Aquibaculum arenosum]|uniref:Damage-inducible protein n=1 Tax=Aquibaculum arenosum TaxID=3032591 RepID=A0ABT5YLR9_9PROT|nr:damage-inducible protein [Fodinicurvata sp. CAU 1616]MDF2095802.1 damage-inducible protein [Fodinicurvata sp. CAU 1616]
MTGSEPENLEVLRAHIRRLEQSGGARRDGATLSLGAAALDRRLPGGGLPLAGLHEVRPAHPELDDGPATGFLLLLAARLLAARAGRLLWVSRADDLHAPAAAVVGLSTARLLRACAARREDLLWALEQGLDCPALAGVVGEVDAVDAVAARRLQLAAEKAGRPCFLLQRSAAGTQGRLAGSPALTRWQVAALPSDPGLPDLVGRACWQLDLLRCRGGRPASFEVEWDDATGDLALAAPLRDRAAAGVA